jgi:Kef-type K+ transport system membrane component KefB
VTDQTRFLAELGVIFLMFTVGLEFSLPVMFAARDRPITELRGRLSPALIAGAGV